MLWLEINAFCFFKRCPLVSFSLFLQTKNPFSPSIELFLEGDPSGGAAMDTACFFVEKMYDCGALGV